MRRQAFGAPRAPMADLESPLVLVVGGRCPCSLPRCGWLHCRPLSGSADLLIKAFSGQAKGLTTSAPSTARARPSQARQRKARTAVWLSPGFGSTPQATAQPPLSRIVCTMVSTTTVGACPVYLAGATTRRDPRTHDEILPLTKATCPHFSRS